MSFQPPIIHVGLHKTGTTWFQRQFYPKVNNCIYIDRGFVKEKLLLPGDSQFNSQEVMQDFQGYNKRIVICEENLTIGLRDNSFIQGGLIKRISKVFPNAIIVLFLRNQVEKIASTYCYYLKNNGGTFGFNKFVNYRHDNPYNNFNFKPENLLYHNLLELIYRYFSKESVYIFLYEDFSANNLDFLMRFATRLGIDIDIGKISFIRENERIRKGLIPVARFSNLFTKPCILHRNVFIPIPGWTGLNQRVLSKLNKWSVFGKPPSAVRVMGKEDYAYFSNFYRESNRKLIENYGLKDIEKFNYPL